MPYFHCISCTHPDNNLWYLLEFHYNQSLLRDTREPARNQPRLLNNYTLRFIQLDLFDANIDIEMKYESQEGRILSLHVRFIAERDS